MTALLHPDEAADRLGVTTRTLRRIVARGDIPRVNVGSKDRPRYRVSEDALASYIARQTQTATA